MRYHLISVLSVLAAILLGSLAKPFSPRWDDMRTKHSWNAVPENWESLGNPLNGTTINLYVALKAHHKNALIDTLYEVSDPNHPRYGTYLSKERIAELVSPPPRTLEFVNLWLEYHGVPSSSVSMTHGGTTLTLSGVSIIQANALLGASYQLYRHVETNETIVRTVGYALPTALHRLVQTVVPTMCFSTPHTQWHSPHKRSGGAKKPVSGGPVTVLSSRDGDWTTPSFLRSLYKTTEYTPAAADRNAIGIVGILNDYPSPEDLAMFVSEYRSDGTDAAITIVQVNGGGYDPTNPAGESNLDTQYTVAMAYPTPVIFYSVGRGPEGTTDSSVKVEGVKSCLDRSLTALTGTSFADTISISYVIDERFTSKEYAMYMCAQFGMLGALGVSVLVSTGDDGVGRGDCVANDGSVRFISSFPATCPYVTAVGGTTGSEPEFAASLSGGGFSNIFQRPYYQEQAVTEFLQHLGNQYLGKYNATSRGIPDISAQALNFPVFIKGEKVVGYGTSVSAPIVAAMISLLNDYLISQGKVTLGFLNPWLYGTGMSGLTDITSGSNPGCNTDGFSAIEGWDPVTGLGTLDFQRLLPILPDYDGAG